MNVLYTGFIAMVTLDIGNVAVRIVCLRNIDVKKIFELIDKYEVTHFEAPIVLNMLANAPKEDQKQKKSNSQLRVLLHQVLF